MNYKQKLKLAKDPNTDPDILAMLSQDSDLEIRSLIADNKSTPHYILTILSNDSDFNVRYQMASNINSSPEFDGSDSGGNQEEAISWAKIKPKARKVKVVADATLTFPLLISSIEKV